MFDKYIRTNRRSNNKQTTKKRISRSTNNLKFIFYFSVTMDSIENFHFNVLDYCVFGAMLVLSAMSGVYFGCYRKKKTPPTINISPTDSSKKSTDFGSISMNEYLLGSRKLKAFPIAMSLVAR